MDHTLFGVADPPGSAQRTREEKAIEKANAKAEAQAWAHRREQERVDNGIALLEVLDGNVHWLERGNYRAGLLRPDSPCGGLVITVWKCTGQRNTVHVWRMDDLYREMSTFNPHVRGSADPDTRDLAELVRLVRLERDRIAGY